MFIVRRQVLEVVEAVGSLDGERLKQAQEWFARQNWRRMFLMLRLVSSEHRRGQPEKLNQASLLMLLSCGRGCWQKLMYSTGGLRCQAAERRSCKRALRLFT